MVPLLYELKWSELNDTFSRLVLYSSMSELNDEEEDSLPFQAVTDRGVF